MSQELWRVALNAYHSPEYGASPKVIWQRVVDAISKELLREDEPVAWLNSSNLTTFKLDREKYPGGGAGDLSTARYMQSDYHNTPVFLRSAPNCTKPHFAPPTHPAPKVPAGWQFVPKEPTDAMLMAGHRCIDWCRDGQNTYDNEDLSQTEVKIDEIVIGNAGTTCKQDLIDAWQAMLAAAPKGETE